MAEPDPFNAEPLHDFAERLLPDVLDRIPWQARLHPNRHQEQIDFWLHMLAVEAAADRATSQVHFDDLVQALEWRWADNFYLGE